MQLLLLALGIIFLQGNSKQPGFIASGFTSTITPGGGGANPPAGTPAGMPLVPYTNAYTSPTPDYYNTLQGHSAFNPTTGLDINGFTYGQALTAQRAQIAAAFALNPMMPRPAGF